MRTDTLYLRNSHRSRNTKHSGCDPLLERYRPLIGVWAIDIVLMYRVHEVMDSTVVTSSSFEQLTGATIAEPDLDDEDYRSQRWKRRHVRSRNASLAAARKRLMATPVDDSLPLVRNVSMLAKALGLTPAEQFLLMFAAALAQFPEFQEVVAESKTRETNEGLAALLRHVAGMPSGGFKAAMHHDSTLAACGVLKVSRAYQSMGEKLDLLEELSDILLDEHDNVDALMSRFVRKVSCGELSREHYPHLRRDLELSVAAMAAGLEGRNQGVNLVFHGKPGTGKTEFAKVLADACGAELYEIAFSSADGSPIRGVE